MTAQGIYGYDGTQLEPGCRIELHPAVSLWMRGARFGTLERFRADGSVVVRVDRLGVGRKWYGRVDDVRRVES
jgi:hypothetical protein